MSAFVWLDYRDTMKLFLAYVACQLPAADHPITAG